jgi:Methyltransferase domain
MALRETASRLGIDQSAVAQTAYRGLESARSFLRGYRYGQHFPSAVAAPGVPRETSPLEAYAEQHRSGPGLFKWQHYFEIYDRHLARFRGQPVTLVEIGVAGGGSLGMWRDYLGPDARIVGVDIDPECRRFACDGIEVMIGDQGSPGFWGSFSNDHGQLDIVIDDGSHLPEHQIVTLKSLLPAIRPGGVYVCEDIHGPFQPFHAFIDGLTRNLSAVGFADEHNPANALQRQVASVHRYPLMVVIEKVVNSPKAFETGRHGSEWPEDWTHPSGGNTKA